MHRLRKVSSDIRPEVAAVGNTSAGKDTLLPSIGFVVLSDWRVLRAIEQPVTDNGSHRAGRIVYSPSIGTKAYPVAHRVIADESGQ